MRIYGLSLKETPRSAEGRAGGRENRESRQGLKPCRILNTAVENIVTRTLGLTCASVGIEGSIEVARVGDAEGFPVVTNDEFSVRTLPSAADVLTRVNASISNRSITTLLLANVGIDV